MNFTKISLDNNRVTIMVLIVIIVMGISAYNNLSRDSMPPYTLRFCNVVTRFPGASPERVEKLITEKIEEVAQELPELKTVTSESRTGLSVVSISLADDTPPDQLQSIWDRLRRKIESIQQQLPDGSRPPNVQDDGIGVVYGVMLGMLGDGFSNAELEDYAEDIRDELVKLDDASEVEIKGIQAEQIYVEFDNASLADIGLSANQLQQIIATTNIVYSGGQVSLEDERIVLEPTGNFETVDDLKKTLITLGNTGQALELGDITHITRRYKSPPDGLVRINGTPGLAISVALKEGANLIRLGQAIDEKVTQYNQQLPIGIEVTRTAAQDYYVDTKVSDFINNVFQSVGIVLVVMLLFLGLRTGFVVASLIPTAMVMTLWLMELVEVGLTQVSLAALIMALGLLVDNAIVVSESMMVKMEEGMKPRAAAISACQELLAPLLVSSLTTSAAFLAFYLAPNTMGEMMGVLFVVISLALLSSWILAMTLIPLLGAAFIRVDKKEKGGEKKQDLFDRLNHWYKIILLWVLKRPLTFVALIVAMFVGSLMLFGQLPFIFFPDSDRNLVTVNLNLPLGTKIERTEEVVSDIETYIQSELLVNDTREAGIVDWTAFIGQGPASYDLGYQPGEANSGYAHMLLNTSSFEANNSVIRKLDQFCFQSFPNAEVTVSPLAGGGGGGSDVAIRISGNSPEELMRISENIKQKMVQIPGAKNISDNWGPKIKKLVIDINQDNANRAGLTNQDIAISLQTALDGFNSGSFRENEDNIPITMRIEGSEELDVRQLNGLNIFSQSSGRNVPLVQVASIEPDWQFAKILRRDLYRTMTIECDAADGFTASNITDILTPWLEEESTEWGSGYRYSLGGESEQSAEAMGAVVSKLPLAGFIIILLLVLQFNSFRKTTMVLSTIPLGVIGVIFGLLLFQSYFGFMAFLGVISLAGIVINNAIVLIDRIKIEIEEGGKQAFDAIVDASQQRFRPILLTTFTTTLGLIPLYLGGGLMWEPMAVSIMVGLLFATVITLLFVPVMYKLLFRVQQI
ncbi:MAG: efflux RND transporter permease subunit [Bacteroidota bacterium]